MVGVNQRCLVCRLLGHFDLPFRIDMSYQISKNRSSTDVASLVCFQTSCGMCRQSNLVFFNFQSVGHPVVTVAYRHTHRDERERPQLNSGTAAGQRMLHPGQRRDARNVKPPETTA